MIQSPIYTASLFLPTTYKSVMSHLGRADRQTDGQTDRTRRRRSIDLVHHSLRRHCR